MSNTSQKKLKFLDEALRQTAFFSEAHSIKGMLALQRLSSHFPHFFSEERVAEMAQWNQILKTPKVFGLCSNNIEPVDLSESHQKDLLDGAVFPLAYLAAISWVRQRGLKNLILAYKNQAIERIGYLGHSWTIWCSFLEIEPFLENEEHVFFAAERFTEFIATQLSTPDWTSSFSVDFSLETESHPEQDVIDIVLSNPGYFAHSVITLAYMLKYREEFSLAEWSHSLTRMLRYSQKCSKNEKSNIFVPKPIEAEETSIHELQTEICTFLDSAPKEAHSLTLTDAIWDLWHHVNGSTKHHLLAVLKIYGNALSSFKRDAQGQRI